MITRKATSHIVVFVTFSAPSASGAAAPPDPDALDKAVRITALLLRTA